MVDVDAGLRLCHQVLRSVDEGVQSVLDALQAPDAGLNAPGVLPERRDVAVSENVADLVEREVERPEPLDRARLRQLVLPVEAVPRVRVGARRPQEADLVVVAERADREAGEPREAPDREQVGHSGEPRVST